MDEEREQQEIEQQEAVEMERMAALQAGRKASAEETPSNPAEDLAAAVSVAGLLMLGLAGIADTADFFGAGLIFGVEDSIDVLMGMIIWTWVKIKGLDRGKPWWVGGSPWIAAGTEVGIPFLGDLPPSHTIAVAVIIIMNTKQGKKLVKKLSPI